MFAVIKTGGKQYKVAKDDVFTVEKLAGEAGDEIRFEHVLMLGGDTTTVGAPTIDGAAVVAEVVEQTRGEKVISFKKRRRKHSSQRRRGHRQHLTKVRITDILADGSKAPAKKKAAPKADAAPEAAPATAAAAPANLMSEAPAEKDDLKKLSGVGPKLETTLNEAGVYTFAQIAAWGPEDIAYMDEKLSFKGRIERENWIEQAKEFAGAAE
ncbi:50S ribosomal protein L21 [Pontivivens ytuae]|uniref:Large ribosomal subunit protein bL21 n=1 Tax=Pontivivens ytuae TaxID=2789856 RepID=A0A7S9LR60_9RHOB|nr:50S ribosomal protein L21 [Pontivivens ytuae]QPH53235.1 50S ribosomal protein L21 [Pontivivens ytuae]